jgi:hypothetical protein
MAIKGGTMRSRHNKTRRSRISPIDRLIQTPAGSAIVAAVKSNSAKSSRSRPLHQQSPTAAVSTQEVVVEKPETAAIVPKKVVPKKAKPKRKNIFKRAIHRLQYPVGWWPVIVLTLTWIVMLGIIWRSFQEIISLGASPTQQSIAQLERKALLEFLAALCLGGIGLCLALTPALKRPPRGKAEPLEASLDVSADE